MKNCASIWLFTRIIPLCTDNKTWNDNFAFFDDFHIVHSNCRSFLFISTKRTKYIKYIYLSPFLYYTFRCLLHNLQGDNCITCSKTVYILQKVFIFEQATQFEFERNHPVMYWFYIFTLIYVYIYIYFSQHNYIIKA